MHGDPQRRRHPVTSRVCRILMNNTDGALGWASDQDARMNQSAETAFLQERV